MQYIWEALVILFIGFCLLRIAGKKTVAEMTGIEIVTLLSIASVIGHAVTDGELLQTVLTLSVFVALLILIQYLAVKFNWIEKVFMGRATLIIQDGKIRTDNLKKLRMSVDQIEAKLREKGISLFTDVKTATIEMNGGLGYELKKHAKPVTFGELEELLSRQNASKASGQTGQQPSLFEEIVQGDHTQKIPKELE